MHIVLPIMVAIAASAAPAQARSDLEEGFVGSLRGCEEWILNPASWADGPESFVTAVRLGAKMALVNRVEDVNLPPKELRQGNHYWRINSTPSAGYVLVVSDTLPMCHITGGGDTDLQPVVTAVISSTEFKARWEELESNLKGGMASTLFRSRHDPALSIVVSRAVQSGQRLDRVQVLATGTYKLGN